jgi:hypothetical protein
VISFLICSILELELSEIKITESPFILMRFNDGVISESYEGCDAEFTGWTKNKISQKKKFNLTK